MTYSNINKDKRQPNWWKKVKSVVFGVVVIYLTYLSLVNVYRQWITLKSAQSRKEVLQQRVVDLEKEKKKYSKLVDEATTSAIIERKQRQYFGIGGGDDYWIVVPSATEEAKIVNEVNEVQSSPNVIKWWGLFTGLR